MKKLFIVLLGMSLGAATMAQSGPTPGQKERDRTMKNLREDVKAHEDTKNVVGHDLTHFRFRRAIQEHREVARTHRMINADSRQAKSEGIDHPVATARRQVHHNDEKRS